MSQIIEDITHTYYEPTFSSFSIGISSPKEVGYSVPATSNSTWNTTHDENVSANTISIIDVTASNAILASGLANDGAETVNLISKTFTPNGNTSQSYQWQIRGYNTEGDLFTRDNSITVYQPWLYGKSTASTRPTANQTLVDNYQSKQVANSENSITANYGDDGSTTYWYWFAVPYSATLKQGWKVTDINKGNIEGSPLPGGPLYPSPDTVTIDDPDGNWSSVSYRIYITNDKTRINGGTIEYTNNKQA